jgi:hypothetical protein
MMEYWNVGIVVRSKLLWINGIMEYRNKGFWNIEITVKSNCIAFME